MADTTAIHDLPGLKLAELDRMGPCILCGKPMLQPPVHPMFFCVTVEQAIWDQGAIMRQVGMTQFFGGHGALAQIMGPNADLAKVTNAPARVAVHFDCAGKLTHLLQLLPEGKRGAAWVDFATPAPEGSLANAVRDAGEDRGAGNAESQPHEAKHG